MKHKISSWLLFRRVAPGLLASFYAFFCAFLSPVLAQDSQAALFGDIPRTHPDYVSITYLAQKGIFKGYPDGTFQPQKTINRAEAVAILLAATQASEANSFKGYFPDVQEGDWFAPSAELAKEKGWVKGAGESGAFQPAKELILAEFLKILFASHQIQSADFPSAPLPGIDPEAWYAPDLSYAAFLGIVGKAPAPLPQPDHLVTRSEFSRALYLLGVILGGKDTPFLLERAEAELAQIETYIASNQVHLAKASSQLAVDFTQQAYRNMPQNAVVLGAAKIARSYDWLVDAFVLGIQKDYASAAQKANQAIDKATEAWEANPATQPIARHIKDQARQILAQVGGAET